MITLVLIKHSWWKLWKPPTHDDDDDDNDDDHGGNDDDEDAGDHGGDNDGDVDDGDDGDDDKDLRPLWTLLCSSSIPPSSPPSHPRHSWTLGKVSFAMPLPQLLLKPCLSIVATG